MTDRLWAVALAAGVAAAITGCGPSPRTGDSRQASIAASAGADEEGTVRAGRGRAHDRGGHLGRGRGRSGGRGPHRRHVSLTTDEERMIRVSTVRAEHRPLRKGLQAMGNIYAPPERKAIVSYPFPARIARVLVRPGQWLKRGQPLVTLQAEEVGAAKSALLRARADLELAESSCERERRLVNRGVGARTALLAAEASLKVARSEVEAAEKRLLVLGLTAEEVAAVLSSGRVDPAITLYAPVSGKVVGPMPVLGSMVDQSTEILTILDPTILCVDAEVYERDLAKLRVGQEVSVSVPAYPGEVFTGRISYIGDVVKPETRTITVRSEIDNRDQRLKDGMFADVRLFQEAESPVLALPERAVLDDGEGKLVFVKTESGYRPQPVQVGVRHAAYVEVVEGLAEGDEVVLDGNFQLKSKLLEETLEGHGH